LAAAVELALVDAILLLFFKSGALRTIPDGIISTRRAG
jgi:hypothetical protein